MKKQKRKFIALMVFCLARQPFGCRAIFNCFVPKILFSGKCCKKMHFPVKQSCVLYDFAALVLSIVVDAHCFLVPKNRLTLQFRWLDGFSKKSRQLARKLLL